MEVLKTREELLSNDEFVLSELKRLQWLYGLKYEMRYGQNRGESGGDSVAEHLYGMHIAFHYFWPLEDSEKKWSREKMLSMITWHDIDEIVVGDTIGYDKTEQHRKDEAEATKIVYEKIPQHMTDEVKSFLEEYNQRLTHEAKFVKAIDKIEPIIHLFNPSGKELLLRMGTTFEQNASIKVPFFKDFPVINRFYEVCSQQMRKEGYFTESA